MPAVYPAQARREGASPELDAAEGWRPVVLLYLPEMVDRMRCYLAGPMTGIPHYNVYAFDRVATMWRSLGHDVWTPFDSMNVVFQRHHGRDFDPRTDRCDYGDPLLPEVMTQNVDAIGKRDATILIDGWEQSRGSQLEVMYAVTIGRRLYTEGAVLLVRVPRVTFYDPTTVTLTDVECDRLLATLRETADDPIDYNAGDATIVVGGLAEHKDINFLNETIPPERRDAIIRAAERGYGRGE